MKKKVRTGLALGGGAARGFAHIGVFEVFEEEQIPVDVIAGTSIGSLMGGMYAAEPDAALLRKRILEFVNSSLFEKIKSDFLKHKENEGEEGLLDKVSSFIRKSIFYTISMTKRAFVSEDTMSKITEELIPDIRIEDTEIPFAATSVDIKSGEKYIFTQGSLRTAVEASCSLPGVIAPVPFEGRILVDGGWAEAVPVRTAFDIGADLVVCVNISPDITLDQEPAHAIDILLRADRISRQFLAESSFAHADVVISPAVEDVDWADFDNPEDKITKGREAAQDSVSAVRQLIAERADTGFIEKIIRFIRGG